MDNVVSEIWTSAYRHGSIRAGDYVRVTRYRIPSEMLPTRAGFHREWGSAMAAEVIRSGRRRAMEIWDVPFRSEDGVSSVNLMAYPDSEAVYGTLGSQQETFFKAHPGKDYHVYREASDAMNKAMTSVSSVLYRVDLAVWK
jgi:hypothetical protein